MLRPSLLPPATERVASVASSRTDGGKSILSLSLDKQPRPLAHHELSPAAAHGAAPSNSSPEDGGRAGSASGGRPSALVAFLAAGEPTLPVAAAPTSAVSSRAAAGARPPGAAAAAAATLANADLHAAKASSRLYYDRYVEADGENARLRAELQNQDVDTLTVVRHLEKQLSDAFEEANQFRRDVAQRLAQQSEAEQRVVEHYEELLQERDKAIADFAALVTRLQEDLRQASRYIQQRQEHQQELQELHKTIEDLVQAHERETAALRFQSVDRKMKLVTLERTMREEFAGMVEKESDRLLASKHRGLLARNTALQSEKEDLVREVDDLIVLADRINGERTSMKRVSELHRSAHEEVLRHSVARNRQSREAELKVHSLEARVRQLVEARKNIKVELQNAYEGRVQELQKQLAASEHTAQQQAAELRTMRELAGRVVQQRSDLERFFYVALADCEKYRSARNATVAVTAVSASTRAAREGSGALPTLKRTSPSRTLSSSPAATGGTGSADVFRLTQPTRMASRTAGSSSTTHGCGEETKTTSADSQLPLRQAEAPAAAEECSPPAPPPPPGVSIDDLSWDDKAKVIKALLFYINTSYYGKGS